jgi:NitT/TauT family transport system permease protein
VWFCFFDRKVGGTMNLRVNKNNEWRRPNGWDAVAFPLILCLIALFALDFHQTLQPVSTLATRPITLSLANLPEYAMRTSLRMLVAMAASLIFTLIYGTLAAKSRRAEKILIPALDILQSVPVLGYVSFTVAFFVALFPGRILGMELAAIFAIFTSQAWNMTFSFYQSLRTIPRDLLEVSRGFHLTAWQRFWKLEVPYAMPGLIWNMMVSMSGGWFFIVASEVIIVGSTSVSLPGLGSFLALAIEHQNLKAVGWVLLTMIVVIFTYDQLLFRPLVAWADKFQMGNMRAVEMPSSWILNLLRRTRLVHRLLQHWGGFFSAAARVPWRFPVSSSGKSQRQGKGWGDILWNLVIIGITLVVTWRVIYDIHDDLTLREVGQVALMGMITMLRVILMILLSSLIWVPLGVIIGLRPALAEKVQPVAQFLAAFPANLLFPFFVIAIVHFHLNPDIWLSPLIVLGTQWYILFNVVAGCTAFPPDYLEAARNFHIRGWQWWRRVILPGILPFYVTGAITAFGGAWNASIVAEFVQWGNIQLTARGLGSYIAQTTAAGDFPRITLGIAVMALFVTLCNRLIWRPIYDRIVAQSRVD